MKTAFLPSHSELVQRTWFLIDAKGQRLGRVAAKAASILRGKNKASYEPSQETGDFIVIINAGHIQVSGRKREQKMYYYHTGFPGGIKKSNFSELLSRHPSSPLEIAIRGMLPKGPLGRKIFKNVKIYSGEEHPHNSQLPKQIEV